MNFRFTFDPNEAQWFDGMVLSCHQFQQEQVRQKNTSRYIMSKVAPYSWGVTDLNIDLPNLGNQVIQVNSIECILPDYSLFFYPMYDQKPVQLDLSKYKNTGSEHQYVYLTMPDDYTAYSDTARYESRFSFDAIDLNTGDNKQKIIRLTQKLTLSVEKPSYNSIWLPIAKFSYGVDSDLAIKLLSYDPPTPNFNHAIYTKKRLETIMQELYTKIQETYAKIKMKNNPDDFRSYGYLILRELWPLQALLNSACPNPFEVYTALTRLCASMTLILDTNQPLLNESYDHLDIYNSFDRLICFVEQKILAINNMYSVGMRKFDFDESISRFSSIIPAKELGSGEIKLLIQFDLNSNFENWIMNAIMSSHNVFEQVKINRTTGCIREIIDSSRIIENKRCVTVKLKYDKESLKSNLLYIVNNIYVNDRPIDIYLLEG